MKFFLKEALAKLLKYPPFPAMTIDNLYGYLDALHNKRSVEGPVVEIGCANGGTTALACRFLSRIGCEKDYFCFDTFSGFVQEQLQTDHQLGLTTHHDRMFSANSIDRFKNNLSRWGIHNHVHVIEGDICKIEDEHIPQNISVALLDVDLRDPIFVGLQKLYANLAKGGVILVDDCKTGTSWIGANVGYRDFIASRGLQPKYFLGFGVIENTGPGAPEIPWQYSSSPNPIIDGYYS